MTAALKVALGLVLAAAGALAQAAGFQWIDVPADAAGPRLRGAVWYPCDAPAVPIALDSITIHAVRNCPLHGEHLPLVVMSHGTGGSLLGHHDTAEALADAGFVVAAINHPGDNFEDRSRQLHLSSFLTRPQDIRRLVDYMTAQWGEHARLDANAIGMFGFSRGGYTGLVTVGAVPDLRLGRVFCIDQPDAPFCHEINGPVAPALLHSLADGRIKAAVIADPLALFTRQGLAGVGVPSQLWASERGGDGVTPAGVEGIRRTLPAAPDYHVVPNSAHFAFLAPCSREQEKQTPALCDDAPGFDRVAFHRAFNAEVVAFFQAHLRPG